MHNLNPNRLRSEHGNKLSSRPRSTSYADSDAGADCANGSNATSGIYSVAYFTDWAVYARDYHPSNLPYEHLTHVMYAFGNVDPVSGEVYLTDTWADVEQHYPLDDWSEGPGNMYGALKQLFLLKQANRNLKVLLSVGGWTYSSNFAGPLATDAGRQHFAETAVTLLENLGLDGLDVDWEYPQDITQAQYLSDLLRKVRQRLDVAQRSRNETTHFWLTVACPAGPAHYRQLDVAGMVDSVDMWNLMAYDYTTGTQGITGHASTYTAVQFYLDAGVATEKLNLGMPLYGRAFAHTDGLGQSFQGGGSGGWEPGIWDVKDLPLTNCLVSTDNATGSSWCYDPQDRLLVSYDTRDVAQLKSTYVHERGLGGGMWWESSADRPWDRGSNIQAFIEGDAGRNGLNQSMNCLSYPGSNYSNVRNNMS